MYHLLSKKISFRKTEKRHTQTLPVLPVTPAIPLPISQSIPPSPPYSYIDNQSVLREAEDYLHQFYQEQGSHYPHEERLERVRADIERHGTYWQTGKELAYGAQMAWRNHTRCIGRLHWKSLTMRDLRHLSTAAEVFAALVEHLQEATNGGKIRSMITIFAPQYSDGSGIRIWNPQLIRYAGYKQDDHTIIGDPLQSTFTAICQELGWSGGTGGRFDLLPLVIQMPGQSPELFTIPSTAVLEVPICHPDFPWFSELDIKWYALPVVSNMCLKIGGVTYPCAPFNGWYMATEVGRNLGDADRYNLLPTIAERLGLDTRSERTLWRDTILIELNRAILHSFNSAGVTIVDHHTASRQFLVHEQCEAQAGRPTYGDWGWLVPPISGSLSPIFHRPYEDRWLQPNFFAQPAPWENNLHVADQTACPVHAYK